MEILIILLVLSSGLYLVIDGQINIPTEGCCGCFLILFGLVALPILATLWQIISLFV